MKAVTRRTRVEPQRTPREPWTLVRAIHPDPLALTPRTILFGLYCVCVIVIGRSALHALVDLSRSDSSASHLVIVPFVALALVYRARESVFASTRFDWRGGLTVALGGIGWLVAAAMFDGDDDAALPWFILAIVVLWTGGFLLFYGRSAFAAARFPLSFLLFMVPIPPIALDGFTQILRVGSAKAAAGFFTVAGMPYHQQDFTFTFPTVAIEIAKECSGIRSSIALVLTALVAGHMFLRTWWRQLLLVAVVLPTSMVKNGFRIAGLVWLTENVDRKFLSGRLHHDGGVLFFLLALILLAPVLVLLRRSQAATNTVELRSETANA